VQPTFYLDRIAITGNEEIQSSDLNAMISDYMQKRSIFLIKRSHLFFFNEKSVEQSIRDKYGLESITFTSHWPSKSLQIDVKEKSSILVYSVDDQYFTIDKQGTIIRQTTNEEIATKEDTPTIYQFDKDLPQVGEQVLTENTIASILSLYSELQKYPFLSIHSFRLKPANKQTIVIPEKLPESESKDSTKDDSTLNAELENLADSIAQAKTVEDKISEIKSALSEIDIEKLEEGEIERYLEQEKVFEPNDSITFDQLEVYTNNGWSLLLGTEPLQNPDSVKSYLNVFATLNSQLSIEGEVKEYIDLRFPNRVYYR
jgi:cell division septal protein FtsQ